MLVPMKRSPISASGTLHQKRQPRLPATTPPPNKDFQSLLYESNHFMADGVSGRESGQTRVALQPSLCAEPRRQLCSTSRAYTSCIALFGEAHIDGLGHRFRKIGQYVPLYWQMRNCYRRLIPVLSYRSCCLIRQYVNNLEESRSSPGSRIVAFRYAVFYVR